MWQRSLRVTKRFVVGWACLALLLTALPAAAKAPSSASTAGGYDSSRAVVKQFIDTLVARHGFTASELTALFATLRPQPSILKAILPAQNPETQRSWQRYRARFLTPARIQGGLAYWRAQQHWLEEARRRYGVPEAIIVAIIGIETEYGRNMGNFRVAEALATLAFDYPPRSEYFTGELEQWLLLCRSNHLDAGSVRGSFAGAVGIAQFMPGSYRRYAVDFDGDGRIDLRKSHADAVGSVASFLTAHGWLAEQPIAVLANIAHLPLPAYLIDNGVLPRLSRDELAGHGVTPAAALEAWPERAALIDLPTPGHDSEYWLGFDNFYVITRYNRSSFYAMAVTQLADELHQAMMSTPAHPQKNQAVSP